MPVLIVDVTHAFDGRLLACARRADLSTAEVLDRALALLERELGATPELPPRRDPSRALKNKYAALRVGQSMTSVLSGLAADARVGARKAGSLPVSIPILVQGQFPEPVAERVREGCGYEYEAPEPLVIQALLYVLNSEDDGVLEFGSMFLKKTGPDVSLIVQELEDA